MAVIIEQLKDFFDQQCKHRNCLDQDCLEAKYQIITNPKIIKLPKKSLITICLFDKHCVQIDALKNIKLDLNEFQGPINDFIKICCLDPKITACYPKLAEFQINAWIKHQAKKTEVLKNILFIKPYVVSMANNYGDIAIQKLN